MAKSAKSSKPNRVAIPRNQTKLVSSPCITVRFFSVRTAISACTDQNSFPRSIKHPLLHCKGCSESVITLHPPPSSRAADKVVADSVVLVSTTHLRVRCPDLWRRGLASLLPLPPPPASDRLHPLCLLHTALFIELGPPRFVWLGLGFGWG